MSFENRNLKAGTKLVARFKGMDYEAEVGRTKDGLRYRLASSEEFKSLWSAGSVVMGGNACNGWRFWSLAGLEPTPPAKTTSKAQVGPAKKKPAKTSKKKAAKTRTPASPKPKSATRAPAKPTMKPEAAQKPEPIVGDLPGVAWRNKLRNLKNERIRAYCPADFEGRNSREGWMGTFVRDILEEELEDACHPGADD